MTDGHPRCTCGKRFASMGEAIGHWSENCNGKDVDIFDRIRRYSGHRNQQKGMQ